MTNSRILSIFLLILITLPSINALTAAVRGRASIDVEASPEKPAVIDRTFYIENRNNISVKVSYSVEEKYEIFVKFDEKEIVLKPGESKDIPYTLTIDRGGNFEVRINVIFEPADPTIKENNVGVPVIIGITSKGPEIPFPEPEKKDDIPIPNQGTDDVDIATNATGPTISIGINTPKPDTTEDKDETKDDAKESESIAVGSNTNPLIGILIIVVILMIGTGIFFVVQKLK